MRSDGFQIQVWQLLRDAINYTKPIYIPLLVLFLPSFIISLLVLGMSPGSTVLLSVIDLFAITPFVTGAAIFYAHQNLTNRGATIPDSLQAAGERFARLVFLNLILSVIIIVGLVLLIIPGIYLSVRLSFVFYALMIERRSVFDSLNRSWQLTQGHWWKIFRAFLALIVALVPIMIVAFIIAFFDPGGADLESSFITLLISPFLSVFYVFLFMRFVNSISDNVEQPSGV
jgi:magnesium-transporting ATPase (P-type)